MLASSRPDAAVGCDVGFSLSENERLVFLPVETVTMTSRQWINLNLRQLCRVRVWTYEQLVEPGPGSPVPLENQKQVTKDTKLESIWKIGRLLSDSVVAGSWSGVSLHIVSVSNVFNELFLFFFVVEKHFKSFKSILKTPSSRPLSSFFFVLPLRRTRRLNAWPRAHTQKKPVSSVITEAISPSELVQPPYPVMHCNLILFQLAADSRSARALLFFLPGLVGTEEFYKINHPSSWSASVSFLTWRLHRLHRRRRVCV